MADWLIISCMGGGLGYWIATKYELDGKVGFTLGIAFSLLFSGGLYQKFSRYDSSMKLLLVEFVTLLCLTFLLLLERKTVIAWLKLAALTMIITALSYGMFFSGLNYREAQSTISAAAKDPAGTFQSLRVEFQSKIAGESSETQK